MSISELRRFLHTGVGQFRRYLSFDGFSEFTTVEMALYLQLTARQTLAALDDLRQQNLLSYKGMDDAGVEVWHLTRNGRYVTASAEKAKNRVTKAFIGKAMARLESVAAVGPRFAEVSKVLCHGPWMSGLSYGPVIVDLATRGWQAIAAERRLDMVAAFMKAWHVENSVVDVLVMGFEESDGVPERIATHCLIYDKTGSQADLVKVRSTGKGGLDRQEASYSQALLQEAQAYGLVHSSMEEEVTSASWWLTRTDLRYPVDGHYEAKKMLAVEIFTVLNDAACPLAPGRRPPDIFEPLDEANERWGKEVLKSLRQDYYNERVDVGRLAAEVDDFVERGVFDTIGKKSEQAKLVLSRLGGEGGEGGLETVLLSARDSRISSLEKAKMESEQRRSSSVAHPVHYLVLYDIASQDRPRPVALIRQPGGHNACIKHAMEAYGNQLCRTSLREVDCQWLRWHAGDLMTQVRAANASERDAFDVACEEAGCTLKYILLNEDRTVLGGKGRGSYGQMPVKLGLRIEGLGGADALTFQLDDRYDGLLKYVETHKESIPKDIRQRVEKWWIDARKTPMRSMLAAMAGDGEDDVRLARMVDPERHWKVVNEAASSYSATLRSTEFCVELLGLGARTGKAIRMRLTVGDWVSEQPFKPAESTQWFSQFSNSCGDILHVLRGIGWIADGGIDKSYAAMRLEQGQAAPAEQASSSQRDRVARLVKLVDDIAGQHGPFHSRGCGWRTGFAQELGEKVGELV